LNVARTIKERAIVVTRSVFTFVGHAP